MATLVGPLTRMIPEDNTRRVGALRSSFMVAPAREREMRRASARRLGTAVLLVESLSRCRRCRRRRRARARASPHRRTGQAQRSPIAGSSPSSRASIRPRTLPAWPGQPAAMSATFTGMPCTDSPSRARPRRPPPRREPERPDRRRRPHDPRRRRRRSRPGYRGSGRTIRRSPSAIHRRVHRRRRPCRDPRHRDRPDPPGPRRQHRRGARARTAWAPGRRRTATAMGPTSQASSRPPGGTGSASSASRPSARLVPFKVLDDTGQRRVVQPHLRHRLS